MNTLHSRMLFSDGYLEGNNENANINFLKEKPLL
jgi:hypothetical protein